MLAFLMVSLSMVCLQNPESRTRTVRFRPPKTKYFSVYNLPQSQKLSPGLELAFEVRTVCYTP